jgi:hypothetical protein
MANELELRSAAQRGLAPDRHREVAGAVAGGAAIVECRVQTGAGTDLIFAKKKFELVGTK